MVNTRTFQRSFAGGEVSPEMFGRIDDTHFQSGAAKIRNFIVRPQGPAQMRPGLQFVRATKTASRKARLIPFSYSPTDTLVIELGSRGASATNGYFRFHTLGGTLTTTASAYSATQPYAIGDLASYLGVDYYCIQAGTGQTPSTSPLYWYPQPIENGLNIFEIPNNYDYSTTDYFDIHYVQSGDVLTLVHPNYPPMELRRYGATQWVFSQISFAPKLPAPTNLQVTATPGQYYNIGTIAQHPFPSLTNALLTTIPTNIDLIVGDYLTVIGSGLSYLNGKNWVIDTITASSGSITLRDYAGGALFNISFDVSYTVGTTYVNWTGHTLVNGTKVRFTTTGGFPGTVLGTITLNGTTTYYVRNSDPANNRFSVSETPTGTLLSFTSAGSGTNRVVVYQNGSISRTAVTSDITQKYKITAVDSNNEESLASADVSVNNNLYVVGAYNTLVWNVVNGAVRYNIYKEQSGLYGYLGQSETVTFRDDNIAPDMGTTIPIIDSSLTTQYNYPAAVSYFEQRRCFAGTINSPQSIWMTRSGTESNLSYGIPVKDSDRIFFKVSAREANTIRHIVPLNQLILLTNAAEWRVSSLNSDALTPSSVAVRPQSYVGANNVQPCVVNNTLVYCANRGGHVRELGYNWQAQSYITGDLSIRAGHLFDGYTIKDMAYAKAPNPVLWFVSSTGSLLGLTYIPEEQVGAWHQHDTGGDAIESCAVVSEGEEDRLYVIVARQIGGTTVRYVERMAAMSFSSIATSFFVDSGLTSTNANPVTTVSGLAHLNGRTVNVLADGKVQSQKVVANGSITLDSAASTVTVGLPIVADLQTLPVAMQVDGYGQGRYKNINKAWLRLYRSSGISIGPDTDNLVPFDPYETTPTLKSDEIQVLLTPSWAASGQVYIRQTNPLPLSVVGLTLEVAVGG